MSALTANESARYGARLFGYLLATALLAGVVAGAGVGIAYLVDPAVAPGGGPPGATAVAVVALFGVLSVLTLLTGLVVVGFVAVTDAVRLGIERSAGGTASAPADADTEDAPVASEDGAERSTAERSPAGGDRSQADSTQRTTEGDGTDPGSGRIDPTDPVEDPHSASSDPLAGPAEAGEAGSQEAWREEIEEKIGDEGR